MFYSKPSKDSKQQTQSLDISVKSVTRRGEGHKHKCMRADSKREITGLCVRHDCSRNYYELGFFSCRKAGLKDVQTVQSGDGFSSRQSLWLYDSCSSKRPLDRKGLVPAFNLCSVPQSHSAAGHN